MDADEWNAAAEATTVTVEQLDAMVVNYTTKRKAYEDAKKISTEHYHELEKAETSLQNTLKAMNKKSYKLEGVGTFTRVMKEVIATPKTIEDKRHLWNWISEKYDRDVLDDMLSINHAKLNSFYRQEAEKSDDPAFAVPGIAAPTAVENVSFRKG